MYTEKELDLAKRYMLGECNEIQMNYIISTEHMNKDRVEKLISEMTYRDPVAAVAKLMLVYIMAHFLFCLLLSIFTYIRG